MRRMCRYPLTFDGEGSPNGGRRGKRDVRMGGSVVDVEWTRGGREVS